MGTIKIDLEEQIRWYYWYNVISIISIVWGAFLMHYIFGMFVLGFSTFSVEMFLTEYRDW